ncbi:family 14 glycosylhydrolase [Brevibacillus dissolubilis]|uniref:family 14 glycosylhydrolase n=1 Tax=Brevibacillus dissolubilis TaxID=1844116 RepID=UPI001115BD29|nr:family 14 glycosylhydrolase [Brevibacillus dissolubilis]
MKNTWKDRLKKSSLATLSLAVVAGIFAGNMNTASATVKSDYKTYVMAPLTKITDWTAFKSQLTTLKNNGVYALTTDVWWGDVEAAGDNQFNWTYYKTYADTVRAAGLKWVPIISTHQCGGNVGDDCNVPLPNWLWSQGTADQMKFKDESGYVNGESLSPWWSGTQTQYDELYASFASNFAGYKDIIAKIYLSGGPAGELRFPSYNAAAGWSYPSRGKLQAYTDTAKNDFRAAMQTKYGTISALNTAWGTSLTAFSQISPPTDGDNFFINGYKSNYGKDFLNWYQGVLSKHLAGIASKAHSRFDTTFGVRIGAKIAGIHWKMNDPSMPHSAEYGAGYYNYSTILDQFKASNLDLTFTCLEMNDSQANTAPYYSAPKSLVINVANLANSKGIAVNGENALAIVNDNQKYQNVAEMLYNYNFSGFTLLRMANIVNSNGTVTSEMAPFRDAVALNPVPVTFTVNNANATTGQTVYVVGDRWELGKWDTVVYPAKLTNTSGVWKATVYLGENRTYNFKAIKKDGSGNVVWEGGSNKNYSVPAGGGSYTWSWTN